MKLSRLFGIALVVVFALSALVVSAASASDPEFTVLPTVKTFKSTSGLSILRSPTNSIDCATDLDTGEIKTMDEVGKLIVTFHGCKEYTSAGTFCGTTKSVGGTEGLITTSTLRGLLGLVQGTKNAALLLEPEAGKVFVKIAESTPCESPELAVEGKLAGAYSPTGKLQTTGKLSFEPSTAGGDKQSIKEILVLAGLEKPELKSFGALESSEETIDTVEYGGNVEVD